MLQAQTPVEADERRRADVMARIGQVVAEGLQEGAALRVQPYGSFVSGLYTPAGDLDIALEGCVRQGCARGAPGCLPAGEGGCIGEDVALEGCVRQGGARGAPACPPAG